MLLTDVLETITMMANKLVCCRGNAKHIMRRWQSGWNLRPKLRDF